MAKLKFEKPKGNIEVVSENGYNTRFEIKTLERGYGTTIGNSLRRVLLSSVPGAAIVNVKIEGVDHEFSVIDGVYEDVMTIILALKNVVIKVDSEDDDFETKISIFKTGPCKVVAGDFDKVSGVEIINPDLEIANLSDGAVLNLTATVRRGAGYVIADLNKKYAKNEIGLIAIDSLFSPIRRVTYNIEKTRGDDDILFLDVETNGAIDAKDAVATASKMLIDYFEVIREISQNYGSEKDYIVEVKKVEKAPEIKTSIDMLNFKVTVFNALKKAGIKTVDEITKLTEDDLKKLDQVGPEAIKNIKEVLKTLGLKLLEESKLGDE